MVCNIQKQCRFCNRLHKFIVGTTESVSVTLNLRIQKSHYLSAMISVSGLDKVNMIGCGACSVRARLVHTQCLYRTA